MRIFISSFSLTRSSFRPKTGPVPSSAPTPGRRAPNALKQQPPRAAPHKHSCPCQAAPGPFTLAPYAGKDRGRDRPSIQGPEKKAGFPCRTTRPHLAPVPNTGRAGRGARPSLRPLYRKAGGYPDASSRTRADGLSGRPIRLRRMERIPMARPPLRPQRILHSRRAQPCGDALCGGSRAGISRSKAAGRKRVPGPRRPAGVSAPVSIPAHTAPVSRIQCACHTKCRKITKTEMGDPFPFCIF